jgi:ankyrin repeat protein
MTTSERLAFLIAIERGDLDQVQGLIHGPIDINTRLSVSGSIAAPPLVIATQHAQPAIVEWLLSAGALVDGVDINDQTACHVAAAHGFDSVFQVLLCNKSRPNLDLVDSQGRTPLELAISSHRIRIVVMLIEAGARLDNVRRLCAAAAMSMAIIKALVGRGIVIRDLRDSDMRTALHAAASRRTHISIVEMLVNECGVDLNAQDSSGDTCSHVAAASGSAQLLQWLAAAGADIDVEDHRGRSPLHFASKYCHADCVMMLLAAGANVHRRDSEGQTALLRSAIPFYVLPIDRTVAIVHALLGGGAALDDAIDNGDSALEMLSNRKVSVNVNQVESARHLITMLQLDFVRARALQVCIGLQSRGLDALQTCEILVHACGPVAPIIRFHHWWRIVTTIKHFQRTNDNDNERTE